MVKSYMIKFPKSKFTEETRYIPVSLLTIHQACDFHLHHTSPGFLCVCVRVCMAAYFFSFWVRVSALGLIQFGKIEWPPSPRSLSVCLSSAEIMCAAALAFRVGSEGWTQFHVLVWQPSPHLLSFCLVLGAVAPSSVSVLTLTGLTVLWGGTPLSSGKQRVLSLSHIGNQELHLNGQCALLVSPGELLSWAARPHRVT